MKIVKVILLLFLVLKTSGLIAVPSLGCCDETTCEIEITLDQEEPINNSDNSDDSGCCDGVCDCLCCSHIFTFQKVNLLNLTDIPNFQKCELLYIDNLSDLYSDNYWQPPRNV